MSEVSAQELRRTMGCFATGVTVVASLDPVTGSPCGLTANAVCSVSLDPPLILVCISNGGSTGPAILSSGHFSVNVLGEEQRELSAHFSRRGVPSRFDGVTYGRGEGDVPILDGALATLECALWANYPGGDHTIFVGKVLRTTRKAEEVAPLVFFGGEYSRISGNEATLGLAAR